MAKINKERRKKIAWGLVVSIFIFGFFTIQPVQTDAIDPYFTLVFKTNGGGVRPDYGNFLQQHLARIGVDVDVIIQDWPTFVGELIAFRDFDICNVGLAGGSSADPNFSGLYDENGSLNLFGYHTSMDWDDELGTGVNEWYIKQGTQIMPPNSVERIQHYWDWEQYLMDKICPMLPTFSPMDYQAHWSNLEGYDFEKGIKQSWGNMKWNGYHNKQKSISEVIIADNQWSQLLPIYQDSTSSRFISNCIMDPLIWKDVDMSFWPHLAKSYEYIDDTTIEIVCREGIKWQTDPDGLFTNEFFDVKDVYFTFYVWRYVTSDIYRWDWIESMDIIDNMTLRINVDADPTTPGQQAYAHSLNGLNINILPEHYLNQTQLKDGVYPNIFHSSWNTYGTNAFGTSLFKLESFSIDQETLLKVFNDCWWLDSTITNDPTLNWVERFGDFSGGLNTLRIKIIKDEIEAMMALENGIIDIESVTDDRYFRQQLEASEDFTVHSKLKSSFNFFGFNIRESRDYIGDREPSIYRPDLTVGLCVRKAICYAIDRGEMNNIIHGNEYSIVHWPITPTMDIWCNPNIIRYNHNLEKAREYMYYAGFNGYCTHVNPGFTFWIGFSGLLSVIVITLLWKKIELQKFLIP